LPQLLISVRNTQEAKIVARFPVSIVDIKEPDHGPLGAADVNTISAIAAEIGTAKPLSFSIGELNDWARSDAGEVTPQPISSVYSPELLESFEFVKAGMADMNQSNWKECWTALFAPLTNARPVAVAYFDYLTANSPTPLEVVRFAASQARCSTILFDTYDKTDNLFGSVTPKDLEALVSLAKTHELQTVVAGSVSFECLSHVLAANPDMIGLRGAVCRSGRQTDIDSDLVRQWIQTLEITS